MPSRSNALNNPERSSSYALSPVATSAIGHALVALAVALAIFWKPRIETAEIPFEVLEAPRAAPAPLRPLPLEARPQARVEPKSRQVFGVSRKALTTDTPDENTPDLKAGNTVAKTPDNEKLREEDADSIPIPVDEYLVSRMPELISDFRVPYPAEAKKKGIQGVVLFDLLIDPKGVVRQFNFISGPGFGLNEAAAEAVSKLKFKPALMQDQPVAVRIRYAYRFVLEK